MKTVDSLGIPPVPKSRSGNRPLLTSKIAKLVTSVAARTTVVENPLKILNAQQEMFQLMGRPF